MQILLARRDDVLDGIGILQPSCILLFAHAKQFAQIHVTPDDAIVPSLDVIIGIFAASCSAKAGLILPNTTF